MSPILFFDGGVASLCVAWTRLGMVEYANNIGNFFKEGCHSSLAWTVDALLFPEGGRNFSHFGQGQVF